MKTSSFVQERISSLKAGLRTWQDHLERIQGLHDRFQTDLREAMTELDSIQEVIDREDQETEEDRGSPQERLQKCQVGPVLSDKSLISSVAERGLAHPWLGWGPELLKNLEQKWGGVYVHVENGE